MLQKKIKQLLAQMREFYLGDQIELQAGLEQLAAMGVEKYGYERLVYAVSQIQHEGNKKEPFGSK